MKRIRITSIALAISCACLQPLSLRGQDQPQTSADKKEAKGSHHGNKEASKNSKLTKQTQVESGQTVTPQVKANTKSSVTTESNRSVTRNAQITTGDAPRKYRQESRPVQTQNTQVVVQGNRSNHYSGRWVDASVHRDWNRDSIHEWNHHHYRWYDGGWLIVDFGPSYSPYSYGRSGSLAVNVQERLAERGYYNGPIDGEIGPGTRHAISNYQADYGLWVTGRINGQLLASLGLE